MFVTNHVLSGVLIGRALKRRPLAAFAVGVASHLVLDMVPHWGSHKGPDGLSSPEADELFLRYAKRDGVLGLAVMAIAAGSVEREARTATVGAMAGAALLDLDKPTQHFFGFNPFPLTIRRIHTWVQCESPNGMRNEVMAGVVMSGLDVAASLAAQKNRALA